jgi:hypothetical protein
MKLEAQVRMRSENLRSQGFISPRSSSLRARGAQSFFVVLRVS